MSSEIQREILRKSLHLPGLGIPFLYIVAPRLTLTLLFLLSLLYLGNEWFRVQQDRSPFPLTHYLSKNLTRSPQLDLAPVYLAVGLGLTVFFFPFKAALAGSLLVCGGDVLAAIVGMQWGKKKIPRMNKTYLGSLTFFIASFCFLFLLLGWQIALLIALLGTFIEAFSARGLDNLFLPVVGGFMAYALAS